MAARGGDAKAGTEGLVTGGRPVRTAASCRGLGNREGLEGGARRRGQSPRLETRDVVSGACRGRWTGERRTGGGVTPKTSSTNLREPVREGCRESPGETGARRGRQDTGHLKKDTKLPAGLR